MKKLLLISMLAFSLLNISIVADAQNIVVNGDLESWTAGEPDGWNKAENITQETTIVHGGSSSAKHTSESSTKDLQQLLSGIQEGTEYTISYWYYDNDPSARTRVWSYWTSEGGNLPDNEDVLRPSTYSEDNDSWQEYSVTLVAPATADGFKFEVRVYNQEGNIGGSVYYDDFEFNGDVVINPEPDNYPTGFTAAASGLSVDLTWTDATGTNLPSKYIIFAGTSASLPMPVDGTPISDDLDLSDGSGALNVSFGMEEASFGNLDANTTYYFSIYSYSNAGPNIDYKTDGTAPAASAQTANMVVIETENFDEDWGNWSRVSLVGGNEWDRDNTYGINGTPCATCTGYIGGNPPEYEDSDDWLISPPLNLDESENEILVFYSAMNYTGPDLQLKISTDYDGGGDPSTATWTEETFTWSTGYFEWTESGDIDLSGYVGSSVYVAFHFTSTTLESATWEIDDILITGEEDAVIDPEPTNYPTGFEAMANGTSIMLSWDDATGTQLPDAYIIYAGTSSSLPTPTDGTPVPNDNDLSDGSGALNIAYGLEEAMFDGLEQGSTYYFAIYPYTNNGVNIDFKNDGTAPTAEALVPIIPEPTNYPTSFEATVAGSSIQLVWIDAIGAQLPENYIIYAGTTSSLPMPVDGTPVDDDPDLSDGSATLNIAYGIETASFDNLVLGTTYYFTIYPYTNMGTNIDFKNDGTAPATEATIVLSPEPDNYPSSFAADASDVSILTTWADATGAQLPDGYVIFAGLSSSLPVPTDGVPIQVDSDLSDGSAAITVPYGAQEYNFNNGLTINTTYHFVIYPYTNSGSAIDYKNDGTPPTANATTVVVEVVTIEEENFDVDWGGWTPISVIGTQVWSRDNTYGTNGTPCAKMSGYESQSFQNEDWLISPALNFDDYDNEAINFMNAMSYSGDDLLLQVSTDYDGGGDPNSATWTTLSYTMSPGFFEWTSSGEVDLSGFSGPSVYVAFLFTSSDIESKTWEIDDIVITGEGEVTTDPEPTNYPTDFGASLSGATVVLDWTDATGTQLPAGYLIYAGLDGNLPMPTDGTPVSDDMDLTDGSGAMNVAYGTETATFSMVNSETTYYFTIYPYTNDGATIDYKTDGTPPEANATTPAFETVIIEEENFDVDWGNWVIISVVGAQIWDRDNTYGTNGTPCAKMSGYEGQSNENDDWLISPAMDFTQYVNETIEFQNAMNYSGPELELKVSTDYDGGGDPYTATWTTLSYTMSGGNFEFASSGMVDLSEFDSENVHVAFHYTSTTEQSATWEIDDIEIKGDEDMSVTENDYLLAFANLYPNPTSGFVTVENTDSYFDQIMIQSITGQTIGSYQVKGEVTKFDLSDLQNGIYFVTFINSDKNQSVTKKLIIN